jgi:hypothetical protein
MNFGIPTHLDLMIIVIFLYIICGGEIHLRYGMLLVD